MLLNSKEVDRVAGRLSRRHVTAGVIALLLSLCMHGLLLYFLGSMRFWVLSALPERLRDLFEERPISLAAVRTEEPEDAALQPMPSAEGPDGASLGEELERVSPPAKAALQPPPPSEQWLAGESGSTSEPTKAPEKTTWEPRRDIVAIEERKAHDETIVIPRREVSRIDRFLDTPDIVVPMKREDLTRTSPAPGGSPLVDPLSLPRGTGRL